MAENTRKRRKPVQAAEAPAGGSREKKDKAGLEPDNGEGLITRYRPTTLEDVLGNPALVDSIKTTVSRSNRPHAYLFAGPPGCGKTTLAGIVGRMLGCTPGDFQEINSANMRGIDDVRSLDENSRYRPLGGHVKVYLLDEPHMLTTEAQNALLKLLESPPRHAYFILATTDPQKLKATIRQRCATYTVAPLSNKEVRRLLSTVLEAEGGEVDPDVLDHITSVCEGTPRLALMLLEQVMGMEGSTDDLLDAVDTFSGSQYEVIELCRLLVKGSGRWGDYAELLGTLNSEPEQARYAIMGYMNSVMLKNPSARVAKVAEQFTTSFMYQGKLGLTLACYRAFNIRNER